MNKLVLLSVLSAFFALLFVGVGNAQSRQLGTVNLPVTDDGTNCPANVGQQGFPANSHCYTSTISCPGIADIGFTFGVLGSGELGTIVLFSGADGTSIDFKQSYVQSYNNYTSNGKTGFETIEVVWQQAPDVTSGTLVAWEQSQPTGYVSSGLTSIKQAACRPATLLNFLANHFHTAGGMCAEGQSAGSAAIAYSMAEYNAAYLDAVEFHSGPPLADIEDGCSDSPPTQTVCETGDTFCQLGGESNWMDSLAYKPPAPAAIDGWTNVRDIQSCTVSNTNATAYGNMSIIDGMADSSFSYSAAVSIWVCAPYTSQNSVCSGSNPAANNTGGEGYLFADQIFKHGSARSLNFYRVDQCPSNNNEGVDSGFVPAFYTQLGYCPLGSNQIQADMEANCKSN